MNQEPIIDKKEGRKNRIFFIIFFIILIISVVLTFVRIVVLKDYQIVAETSCDPTTEKCFVWECSVEMDGECSNNPEENVWIYKIVNKKAATIAACEATEEKLGCDSELSCIEGEKDCSYEYCDEESLTDGIRCSDESDVPQKQILEELDYDTPQEL